MLFFTKESREKVVHIQKLIMSALPYANGDLHLGGIRSTYLPADVYARYCRLKGYKTLFVCATDEHGTPIELNAEKEGMPPKEFVAKYHERQKKDFSKVGISFDVFHHTHSEENRKLSEYFYQKAQSKDYIYLKPVEQTYCTHCQRFLPDRYVKGTCPFCQAEDQYGDGCERCGKVYTPRELKKPYCAVCKKLPTTKTVEHVFFKLSALEKPLRQFLLNTSLQQDVVHYVQNWLKELKDWDITRDGPYFGLPIPDRANQYFYVWFDAPIGYVASTQKWCDNQGVSLSDWWSEKSEIVNFIGKDIVYHHYLFWPAMLHLAEMKPPDRLPTRGYLNVEGQKMSKSRGTFILLGDVLAEFSPDTLRYYLSMITPADTTDGNFVWKDFQSRVNNELIGAYGNFVYRCFSFIHKKGGGIPKPSTRTHEDKAFEEKIEQLWAVEEKLERIKLKEALEEIFSFVNDANRYFNNRAPWHLKNQEELNTVLFLSAKAVYSFAVALWPFLPFSSERVFEQLRVQPKKWADLSVFKAGLRIENVQPLFSKIEDDLIEKQMQRMQRIHLSQNAQ